MATRKTNSTYPDAQRRRDRLKFFEIFTTAAILEQDLDWLQELEEVGIDFTWFIGLAFLGAVDYIEDKDITDFLNARGIILKQGDKEYGSSIKILGVS